MTSKLETDIVDAAKAVKNGLEEAGEDALKVAAFLENNAAEISGLAALAGSGSTKVTETGLSLLSLVINAVKDAGEAASANGLSVSFDASVIADVKAVIAAIEKL